MGKTGSSIEFADIHGIRVVSGHGIRHRFKPHIHGTYNIGIIKEGKALLSVQGREYLIGSGDVFFINPNTVHGLGSYENGGYSHCVLCISPDAVGRVLLEYSGYTDGFCGFGKDRIFDCELYLRLDDTFSSILDKTGSHADKKDIAYSLLKELICNDAGTCKISAAKAAEVDNGLFKVEKSISYMHKNWREEIGLDDLSNESKMSKFYFSRVFKDAVGISPYDYFLQLRVKKAQKLLEEGRDIVDVAHESRFYDQSHFCRCFNRFVGVSPLKYLNGVKKL